MAKRVVKEKPKHVCRECKHSYDWHCKDWKGDVFMCRCPYHKNGEFIKFLKDPQCAKFEPR